MKNLKAFISLSLAMTLAFSSACSKTQEGTDVTTASETEETTQEEETTSSSAETAETTQRPTPTPTPTPTPMPTPTSTQTRAGLVYEGEGTINPLPEMSFPEMEMLTDGTLEDELNNYLVPQLGISTEDRFYTNEAYDFTYDMDGTTYNSFMGTPDLITDGEGIFGYYIMDFDKDGTLEMVVMGLAKGTINSNLCSYYYRPYMLLCSVSDNKVFVSDFIYYGLEGTEGYDTNYTSPLAYRSEPAIFTSSDTASFYFLTRIEDTGTEVLLQGYSQDLEGFCADGQFNCAFEMRIRDGRFQYITFARCNGWGSSDQTYTIFSYDNGVINLDDYEVCVGIYPYLESIHWELCIDYQLNWNTVNRGLAYHYGERSYEDGDTVMMIYDIVNH